jgi:hypothetical protein
VTGLSEAELRDLVFGIRDPDAIFIPRVRAADLAAVYEHGEEWSTWGDARAALSPKMFESLHERAGGEPADDDELDLRAETGDFDYWPAPPERGMLDWIPREVLQRFGEVGQPLFGAAFARIRGELVEQAADALRELDYRCEHDQDLVLAALGDEDS